MTLVPFALLAVAFVAVVAAAIAGVVGFGIGSLVTPTVAVFLGTQAAVAIVAVPHLVATSLRLWSLRSSVDWPVLMNFGLASAAGGFVGALLHATLANPVLTASLAILLMLSGISELVGWGRRLQLSGPFWIAAGILSGAFGGLVGNQGGIRSAALMRVGLRREALVATSTASGVLVDIARLPVYIVSSGADLIDAWMLVGALTLAVVVGTLIGVPVLKRLPEVAFRRFLAMLLVVLGLGLLAGVLLGAG